MTWKTEAEKHAEECLPDESCGLLALIKGKETYWPCKNLSIENFEYFVIDPDDYAECEDTGEIIGLVHSHPTGSIYPSETDLASCEFIGLKWYIYSPVLKDWHSFAPSGWKPDSLYGRQWSWGNMDCWSLICDYYKEKLDIEIKKSPRPKTIKEFSENPEFEYALPKLNFIKQQDNKKSKEGDVLLFKGAKGKASHVAVYIGDSMILNHNFRALSCREPLHFEHQQTLRQVYRYAG